MPDWLQVPKSVYRISHMPLNHLTSSRLYSTLRGCWVDPITLICPTLLCTVRSKVATTGYTVSFGVACLKA